MTKNINISTKVTLLILAVSLAAILAISFFSYDYHLKNIKEKYSGQLPSMVSFATGPSRTADIEKTLVVGVHGPKEVYLFLVDKL